MADPSTPTWPTVDFESDPRLVVGFRPRPRRLSGHRVEVHEDAFSDLRELSSNALAEIEAAVPRPYEPYGELERGEEYFWVDVDGLPRRSRPRRRAGDDAGTADDVSADLMELVQHVDELDPVAPNGLAARYAFYALCWRLDDGAFIGFIKKMDPRRALNPGKRWFQYGDVLRHAEPPDLVLEPDVDLVVTDTFVATRNPVAFKDLFNDVQVVLATLPGNIRAVRDLLKGAVPLSDIAATALEEAARRRVSYARRLHDLPARLQAISIDKTGLKREMRRVNVDPKSLLDRDGNFTFTSNDVGTFLDVIEARYFEDALGGEHRRADRFSRRR
jgi:hypothetical protein